ncbi:MAG TPA: tetratricopeptide repeat protein [Caldilineaceae bacterium]|nr:tetratricopeptide repeat protein [Caldilineaceae bacterium]
MQENLLAYLPMDRRQALARRLTLPDRSRGAALFADISGFTPLTEALVRELGRQRGAEELTRTLNLVYDALIDELHRYGGSAIAFAGDAITCWFDGDDGARAAAAALAMQQAMQGFGKVATPSGQPIPLSMKAAVAAGPVRRFLVGDPQNRVIDVLAGETLVRLAAGEHLAQRGEVVLDAAARAALHGAAQVLETRHDEQGRAFGVLAGLTRPVPPSPWPELDTTALDLDAVRMWLLPPVYARLQQGMGDFLAELRPTVALFIRFTGIDYDADDAAGQKLDAYIRWIQRVLERYQGTLIDLNVGDKGSYLYINFGAPIAHEDNAARAAAAALELRSPPPALSFIAPVQIGISQGRMRAGAYGGTMHRTYGVLGDEVNMAARLMMAAQPGQILVSHNAQRGLDEGFVWEALPPLQVKGKREPAIIYALHAAQQRHSLHRLRAGSSGVPLVGRQRELACAVERLDQAAQGRGQLIGLVGDAGIGKSRLVAEIVRLAEERGFLSFGGECEATGLNTAYLVWRPIWRGLLGVDASPGDEDAGDDPVSAVSRLERRLQAIDPILARRAPLLNAVLNLPIPDNELTASFDAKLRKTSLESLLADCLRELARAQPLLLVLEDCHWLDPLSHDLLEVLGQAIAGLPVAILLAYRPLELERHKAGRISVLPYYTEISLSSLPTGELTELARARLARLPSPHPQESLPQALVERLTQQAEGNPFYLEELVNFLRNNGIDPYDQVALRQLELPSSLQALVLSRLDRLSETQKTTLKVASVIGRVFRVPWLGGVYPELGTPDALRADLRYLSNQEFTAPDPIDPETTYFFKHIITHNVVYESLLHTVRTALHEQVGAYLEQSHAGQVAPVLDLLAFHYDRSANESKRRHYLRLAGEAAQATYANEAAIDYYQRLLPLLPPAEQVEVMRKLGEVLQLVGRWDEADARYAEALALAERTGQRAAQAWCQLASGELLRLQGAYSEAWAEFSRAQAVFEELGEQQGVAQVLHVAGTLAAQQGDYQTAHARYTESLRLRRAFGDMAGEARLLNNMAIIAEYQRDLDTAHALHLESLAIRRRLADRSTIANSLNNLGNVLLAQGDYSAARLRLEEAVALQREVGDRWGLANALNNLGNVLRAQGDYIAAGRLYTESLAMNRVLGDRWALAYLLEDLGSLAALQGDAEPALVLIGAAGSLRRAIGAPLPPADQAKLDETIAPAQAMLGEENAAKATAQGAALSLDQALDFALALGPAHQR